MIEKTIILLVGLITAFAAGVLIMYVAKLMLERKYRLFLIVPTCTALGLMALLLISGYIGST